MNETEAYNYDKKLPEITVVFRDGTSVDLFDLDGAKKQYDVIIHYLKEPDKGSGWFQFVYGNKQKHSVRLDTIREVVYHGSDI